MHRRTEKTGGAGEMKNIPGYKIVEGSCRDCSMQLYIGSTRGIYFDDKRTFKSYDELTKYFGITGKHCGKVVEE